MPRRGRRSVKCDLCRKQKKGCVMKVGSSGCERCLKKGRVCVLSEGRPPSRPCLLPMPPPTPARPAAPLDENTIICCPLSRLIKTYAGTQNESSILTFISRHGRRQPDAFATMNDLRELGMTWEDFGDLFGVVTTTKANVDDRRLRWFGILQKQKELVVAIIGDDLPKSVSAGDADNYPSECLVMDDGGLYFECPSHKNHTFEVITGGHLDSMHD